MNELFASPRERLTQAAEGLPRWRWTVVEIERLAANGAFTEFDSFELLGGELVPMSPTGRRHELLRIELADRLTRRAPITVIVPAESQFNLTDDTFVKPDILVHPRAIKTYDLRGTDVLLLIEIAQTSLAYALTTKAPLYASHGVAEYWVIDAGSLRTTVHRGPAGKTYSPVEEFTADAWLEPKLISELSIRLDTLDLG